MKILLSHPYFVPDTPPYGQMLAQIGAAMVRDGHSVSVFSGRRAYRGPQMLAPAREIFDGMQVQRVALPKTRGFGAICYALGLFFTILKARPDVAMVASSPPVIAGFMAAIATRLCGAKLIYHLQDIHPEVSATMGERSGSGWRAKLLRFADNFTLKHATRIIVLSSDMAQTVRARGLDDLPFTVLNNFARDIVPQKPSDIWIKPKGIRRVIFAGNLGRFQALLPLSAGLAMACSMRPDLQIMWLGDGHQKSALQEFWAGNSQAIFASQLPEEQAHWLMKEADIGLVSLAPGISKTSYPSKLLSYQACSLPVLALIERESALAHDITSQNLGVVAPNSNPEAIAEAVFTLLDVPRKRAPRPSQSSQERALECWRDLFKELA